GQCPAHDASPLLSPEDSSKVSPEPEGSGARAREPGPMSAGSAAPTSWPAPRSTRLANDSRPPE
ncbi:Hypothetical predicted protein, partial [Marmota monax]